MLTGKSLGALDIAPYCRWNNRARKPCAATCTYLVVHELEIDPF